MNIKMLIRTQSLMTLAGGMIYPYYLLFLKNLGNSFSKYGLAFAVFTLSSAAASQLFARYLDERGKQLMLASAAGMMIAMLLFPWGPSYGWVILLQLFMGVCNAMQRMSEKSLIADGTIPGDRGSAIGNYHFWTTAASAGAIIAGGYLIDFLTINALFYASAFVYGCCALAIWRSGSKQAK